MQNVFIGMKHNGTVVICLDSSAFFVNSNFVLFIYVFYTYA